MTRGSGESPGEGHWWSPRGALRSLTVAGIAGACALIGAVALVPAVAQAAPSGSWNSSPWGGGGWQHGPFGGFHMGSTLYAAPWGTDSDSCGAVYEPCRTINQAIGNATETTQTIVVERGTYNEDVALNKPLTLMGRGATIDATGLNNGITITASDSSVQGFTVENANYEGILAEGVSDVTIQGNTVQNNDNSYADCQKNYNVDTNPGAISDCGEGVHLLAVTHSSVLDNTISGNSGGILLDDADLPLTNESYTAVGPTADNLIRGNTITNNVLDCGITLPSHLSVADGGGVHNNTIVENTVIGNGTTFIPNPAGPTEPPIAEGSGILMATGVDGAMVADNTIEHNFVAGNGLAGIVVHSHSTNEDLNGNEIHDNVVLTNGLIPDGEFGDFCASTGIMVGTHVSDITATISGNYIADNTVGIWLAGSPVASVTALPNPVAAANQFNGVGTPVFEYTAGVTTPLCTP